MYILHTYDADGERDGTFVTIRPHIAAQWLEGCEMMGCTYDFFYIADPEGEV